ncbi:hypothetical protein ACRCPS_17805 [Pseudomonas aeruginosa]
MKMFMNGMGRAAAAALVAVLSISAMAGEPESDAAREKPQPTDQQVFSALNIMAIPIGPKGMVIKDDHNCLWVVKNAAGVPQLAAVLGESTGKPLCESAGD